MLRTMPGTMLRVLPRAVLLLALLAAAFGVRAQSGTPWEAWLLNPQDGRLTKVDAAGFREDLILPLPGGYDAYDFGAEMSVVVSPDGKQMAYNARQSATGNRLLVFYNHDLRSIIATYDLTAINAGSRAQVIYSPDARRVVIGYSLLPKDWELLEIDLTSFTIASTWLMGGPTLDPGQIPQPVWYGGAAGSEVIGVALLNADGSPAASDGFRWELRDAGNIGSPGYRGGAAVYPPTGETLQAWSDSRFPAETAQAQAANTLQVYEPLNGRSFPIYHDPRQGIARPLFVRNGAYLLFQAVGGAESIWQIIDRTGTPITTLNAPATDLAGTPDGVLYMTTSGTAQVHHLDLRADPTATTGTLVLDFGFNAPLEIVHVGGVNGAPVFGSENYPAWVSILPEGSPGEVAATPATATPQAADGFLREGGTAFVNTTGGDSLNMRSAPGVDFQIRRKLPRGTEVTVLEGPVEQDGFNWWRVREPVEGLEGWVADYVDGVLTLLPAGVTVSGDDPGEVELAANPAMPSLLTVGQRAAVTLSQRQDALRLRNGAGLNFRVIGLLPSGTSVTVVDGPRIADSLTWWQLRTPEGNVGWAAEIVGSERTLTGTGPAGTPVSSLVAPGTPGSTPVLAATATPGSTGPLIPPLLVSPLPGTIITDPAKTVSLSWSPVPGAESYTLRIEQCEDSAGTNCTPPTELPGLTGTTTSIQLQTTGIYRWQVMAVSAAAGQSLSAWWSFEVTG